jgi:hypothetical protein
LDSAPVLYSELDAPTDDDLTSLLAKREHAKPNRVTWALLTLLVLCVGFVGGAVAYQKFAPSSTGSNAGFPGTLPAGFPGFGALPGAATTQSGTSAAAGTSTTGTIKLVDGTNLYLTTATGETVKVKVDASAQVTQQKPSSLANLAPGVEVTVSGASAADGTVTATSVAVQPSKQGAK